ncbi:hypothetical protein [Methylobacterium sp. WL30]|uniref:hypothetical protein n=1 Tax=Methylobacterium sp. WL30 TaxID=2603895 RepID=UPI001FEFBD53|nr:hypothetical protein [Methylobacterium sp. WL30]
MVAWSIRSGPDQPAPRPSTTISWPISSIPAEAEARDEASEKSRPIAASSSAPTSPSAAAMPREAAARERPMDFSVSAVAQSASRPRASAIRSEVRSGHFTWTKCTSSGSTIPAARIAARTPSATDATWARRPTCSGRRSAVWAWPMASAPGTAASSASRTSNTVTCGDRPPSVPPDMTRQTRSAASGPACRPSRSRRARAASPRVQSLTRPLPSVLPKIATIAPGTIRPSAIARSRPETSSGAAVAMRWTTARRVLMRRRARR